MAIHSNFTLEEGSGEKEERAEKRGEEEEEEDEVSFFSTKQHETDGGGAVEMGGVYIPKKSKRKLFCFNLIAIISSICMVVLVGVLLLSKRIFLDADFLDRTAEAVQQRMLNNIIKNVTNCE
jgi:hypothetical protein